MYRYSKQDVLNLMKGRVYSPDLSEETKRQILEDWNFPALMTTLVKEMFVHPEKFSSEEIESFRFYYKIFYTNGVILDYMEDF